MVENISNEIVLGLKNSILKLLKWILSGAVVNAFWICLIICMISLVLYISGLKKAGKYCTVSFIVYIVLEAIGSAFLWLKV